MSTLCQCPVCIIHLIVCINIRFLRQQPDILRTQVNFTERYLEQGDLFPDASNDSVICHSINFSPNSSLAVGSCFNLLKPYDESLCSPLVAKLCILWRHFWSNIDKSDYQVQLNGNNYFCFRIKENNIFWQIVSSNVDFFGHFKQRLFNMHRLVNMQDLAFIIALRDILLNQ